jgi:hypothetical protein
MGSRSKKTLLAAAVLGLLAWSAEPARADLQSLGLPPGLSGTGDPPPGTLWYNGDADGVNSYINQNNAQAQQILYNQFNVTAPGWTVQSAWSNQIFVNGPPASTTATWEIRSGMDGAGGSVVASGDAAATLTPTGFTVMGLTEYMVQVSGLSVTLAPGTYWLTVYPDDSNGDQTGSDSTSGANGIGSPTGTGDVWFTTDQTNWTDVGPSFNTSMGVSGAQLGAVPEPSTLAVALLGGLGMISYSWRRRKAAMA